MNEQSDRNKRAATLNRWRRLVGARRDESLWFYEQAEANECARIILIEYVEELKAKVEELETELEYRR